jgi:hypothetical protein
MSLTGWPGTGILSSIAIDALRNVILALDSSSEGSGKEEADETDGDLHDGC